MFKQLMQEPYHRSQDSLGMTFDHFEAEAFTKVMQYVTVLFKKRTAPNLNVRIFMKNDRFAKWHGNCCIHNECH